MDCIQLRQNQDIKKEDGHNITNKVKLDGLFWGTKNNFLKM